MSEQGEAAVAGQGAESGVSITEAVDALAAVEAAEGVARPDRIVAALDAERVSAARVKPVAATESAGANDVTHEVSGALPKATLTTEEATALMETLRAAHSDAVAELIAGSTVAEIVGSVAGAKAAHARIIAATGAAAPVSGGGVSRAATGQDVLQMTPQEKIAYGLATGSR